MKTSIAVALLVSSWMILEARPASVVSEDLATYRAVYRVEHNGRESGTAEISVRRTPAQESRYEFTSVTRLTGVARLLVPDAAIERSVFFYRNGQIIAEEFSYEDGRKGDGDLRVVFDWNRGVATTHRKDHEAELAIDSGILDRGSLQVALMHDLRSDGVTAAEYRLAGGDALETYRYQRAETLTVDTGLGPISAERFIQERHGASRSTVVWLAPSLSYLPVRIERGDGGDARLSLILVSVDGLPLESAAVD